MGKPLTFQPKVRLEASNKKHGITREKVEKLTTRFKTSPPNDYGNLENLKEKVVELKNEFKTFPDK